MISHKVIERFTPIKFVVFTMLFKFKISNINFSLKTFKFFFNIYYSYHTIK